MLHVWLRAQHSPLLVWQADSKQWQVVNGWQQLQELYNNYRSHSAKTLCLYFPSTHLLQIDTELSASQLKQLGDSGKQYLFEETSIAPVEQLVVRQSSYASTHYLYALAEYDIEAWQQSAVLAGFSIAAIVPDFLLLDVPEEGAGQQVMLYQDEYTTLLRQSLLQGMAVSYLPLLFERLPHLSEVCLLSTPQAVDSALKPSTIDNNADDYQDHTDLLVIKDNIALDKTAGKNRAEQTKALLAEQQILLTTLQLLPMPIEAPERHALNFFIKVSDNKLSAYLRVAAMVALSALSLQVATDALQVYRYNAASANTQAATAAQYQSWFPEDRLNKGNKLQTQMDSKLTNASRASAPHIAALSRISPLIKQSSLKAQSLVMQPTAISFILIAPNRDSLDEFTSTLVSQGLSANLERVNGNEQGVFSGQVTVNIVEDNANSSNASNTANANSAGS